MNAIDLNLLVGLTEQDAIETLSKNNFILRVCQRDGEGCIGTCDMRRDRVNVSVESNVIIEVFGIG
jgi:hypothetical protein